MTKLEKVIDALTAHANGDCTLDNDKPFKDRICPYWREWNAHGCAYQMCTDALELLEERKPRVLTWKELIDVTDPVWYEERDGISSWALCINVTRGNSYEDMSYEFFENYDHSYIREYADKCNVYWRCWTARPTDEQREAVKWDD